MLNIGIDKTKIDEYKLIAKIPVRKLLEYVYNDFSEEKKSFTRAVEGTKAHSYIQSKYSTSSLAEQKIETYILIEEGLIKLTGRIDGLHEKEESIILEEIKSTYLELNDERLFTNEKHIAQLKCYAYMYAKENDLSSIDACLTYINLDNYEVRTETKNYNISELEEFFVDLIENYLEEFLVSIRRKHSRNSSIKNLQFPYPKYRKGQESTININTKAILKGISIFEEAPTGTGKTINALYPAISAMGKGAVDKIWYLTSLGTTQNEPLKAVELMHNNGLNIKTLQISAKKKMCIHEEMECMPRLCPYISNYKEKLENNIEAIIKSSDTYNSDYLKKIGEQYELCPFNLSLDLIKTSDVIICDYNYILAPGFNITEKCDSMDKHVFLVDEAHNIVNRGRAMYSNIIDIDLMNIYYKKLEKYIEENIFSNSFLHKVLKSLKEYIVFLEDLYSHDYVFDYSESFLIKQAYEEKQKIFNNLLEILHEFRDLFLENIYIYSEDIDDSIEKMLFEIFELISSSFSLVSSITALKAENNYEILNNKSEISCSINQQLNKKLKIFCTNPRPLLGNKLKKSVSNIFFSASFSPLEYYSSISGISKKNCYKYQVPSPFPKENLLIMLKQLRVEYSSREKTINELIDNIHAYISIQEKNILVFFPSFKYLELFINSYPDSKKNELKKLGIELIFQRRKMSIKDRKEFLNKFTEESKTVGCVVLGGIFSEGVDLIGSRLSGVCVVTIGLAPFNEENRLIYEAYKRDNFNAYKYTFIIPSWNRILQAVGRVIRSENDKGTVLLIDERYESEDYYNMKPDHWSTYKKVISLEGMRYMLEDFWFSN